MGVFKCKETGTWYVIDALSGLERRTQAEMQAWLCYQAGRTGLGAKIPYAERRRYGYDL